MTLQGEAFDRAEDSQEAKALRDNQRKWELRKAILGRRHHLQEKQLLSAGQTLAEHLQEAVLPLIPTLRDQKKGEPKTVAAYSSIGGEIPMTEVLQVLLDGEYRVLIPKLGSGNEIGWGQLRRVKNLSHIDSIGDWRPEEPVGPNLPPQTLSRASLILVPSLSIDLRGIRLGRGGGWYDRALLRRSDNSLLVGVCWEEEISSIPLPCQTHDQPVDAILTQEGFTLTAAEGTGEEDGE